MSVSFARFILPAIALLAVPASAAERDFGVGNFSELGVVGPYDVTVTTGGAASVRAFGEQADLDQMKAEIRGGRLEIGPRDRNGWKWFHNSKPVKVRVTVPSALSSAGLAGSGDVAVDRMRGGSVSLDISGSGNLNVAAIEARTAKLSIAGSGDITASGRCDSAKLSVAGSGDIRAKGLQCQIASASVAGSGDIAVMATKTASISIMGSGDVTVTGGARCATSKMGSGDADRKSVV